MFTQTTLLAVFVEYCIHLFYKISLTKHITLIFNYMTGLTLS